jgi:hypothetical protein
VAGILGPLDGRVGLLVDLANWTGPDKYEALAAITPYAETCHAKAHWSGAQVDEDDFRRSIDAVVGAGYAGPLAKVYDGDDDEWAGLDRLRTIALGQTDAGVPRTRPTTTSTTPATRAAATKPSATPSPSGRPVA